MYVYSWRQRYADKQNGLKWFSECGVCVYSLGWGRDGVSGPVLEGKKKMHLYISSGL